MTTLTATQVADYARRAGFSGDALSTALAVSRAESGWRSDAKGDVDLQGDGWGPSIGLFQIRCRIDEIGKRTSRDCEALTDPEFNARAAYSISKQGTDWHPWSVFTSGSYRQYLDGARSVAQELMQASTFISPIKEPLDRLIDSITTQFGAATAPSAVKQGANPTHNAIDFSAAEGTPVYAAGDGRISFAGWNTGGGNVVKIGHTGSIMTEYAHLQDILVKPGQTVKRGDLIGHVGKTGQFVTGAHLHFAAYKNGVAFDPLNLFDPEHAASLGDYAKGVVLAAWAKANEGSGFDAATGLPIQILIPTGKQCGDAAPGYIPSTSPNIGGPAGYEVCVLSGTDPISQVARGVGDFAGSVGKIVGTLFDVMFWARLFALLAGAVLAYTGWTTMWRSTAA